MLFTAFLPLRGCISLFSGSLVCSSFALQVQLGSTVLLNSVVDSFPVPLVFCGSLWLLARLQVLSWRVGACHVFLAFRFRELLVCLRFNAIPLSLLLWFWFGDFA